MSERVEIYIKLVEDGFFRGSLIILRSFPHYFRVEGVSHEDTLVARMNTIFETVTASEILRKLEMNNCKLELGGVVFSL